MRKPHPSHTLRRGSTCLVGACLAVAPFLVAASCNPSGEPPGSGGSGGTANGSDDAGLAGVAGMTGGGADSGGATDSANTNVAIEPDTSSGGGPNTDGAVEADLESGLIDSEAGPSGPPVCGDGYRDPTTEECDDWPSSLVDDSCSNSCQVRDVLAEPGTPPSPGIAPPGHTLGDGRHPVAAGGSSLALVFLEPEKTPPGVALKAYGTKGEPLSGVTDVGTGTTPVLFANPVVASLPDGGFAVAWTDFGGDGDELGVRLRKVTVGATPTGGAKVANATVDFSQFDQDVLWTGSELVVAWTDTSGDAGGNIRYRRFNSNLTVLSPGSSDESLASSSSGEQSVALANFQGGWVAAWRSSVGGSESIGVRSGSQIWSVGSFIGGPAGDHPAIAEIDSTHLLLVFTESVLTGGAFVPRLRAAVLGTSTAGSPTFSIDPLVSPYDLQISIGQRDPNVVQVGTRLFVAWRSSAISGDPSAEELWLKEIGWSSDGSGGVTLDLSHKEIALRRWSTHGQDDQRRPALAASSLWPEGALVTAWEDYGRTFGANEGAPDVVFELIPSPVLRLSLQDGGGA